MTRSRVFVTVTVASFALVLLRCAGFSADPTPATEGDGGEAGAAAEAAAEAATEAGPIVDGGADGSEADADAQSPATCAELQAAGTVTSGIYSFNGTERYCEMTLAGGGWTLIARSASGAVGGTFGWNGSQGNVHDIGAYSLDATTLGAFTKLLLGKRGAGNTLVPPIYMKDVPPGFLANFKTSADATTTTTVDGGVGCDPLPGTPSLLQYVGYTDKSDSYFFRDQNQDALLGLTRTGWASACCCGAGGNLDTLQGAIFVR